MTDALDSWARARVNELFHLALGLNSADRAKLLQRECRDDIVVKNEVESLLAAHDRAAEFLVLPAVISGAGPSLPSDAARLVGRQFGQYQIIRVLGEGGMGVVYLAEDHRLRRPVAMKAIPSAVSADPVRRERLRREASAAAQMNHQGIAVVHSLEEFGDDLFIVSEFVAGETLRDEMSRGPADAGTVVQAATELASALAAAHDVGVTHRDLKPENVIRKPDGKLKILDFGLARMRDVSAESARLTDNGTVLGTPGYMSPEQIRRGPLDGRSDLFALGIMLCEMLTGVHPFAAGDSAATLARILESEPTLPTEPGGRSHDRASLWNGLVGIIRVLLRKAPAARFASAYALLAALERVRAGEPARHPAAGGASDDTRRWWRIHEIATSAAYAALLVPIGLAGEWLGNRPLGVLLFLFAMTAAVAAITLRMHLLFAARSMPAVWAHQHARSRLGLRLADFAFVVALATAGLAVFSDYRILAAMLVGAAMLVLLGATIIEPATTRAAFGPPQSAAAD